YLLEETGRLRQACPELPVWLVVAGGRAADTQELVARGTALLGDRVRFLVNFPPQRMPSLYRAADLFVLCSSREMMPVALLAALATALGSLITDPERCKQLGLLARDHFLAHFSRDRVVDQVLAYYQFVHTHGRAQAGSPVNPSLAPLHQ